MIEIKHKLTGIVLATVDADTLERADLSGMDLSWADLRNQVISGASFFDSSLIHADLSGSTANGVDFASTDLQEANLSDSILGWAKFQDSQLGGADFSDAFFIDTLLINCGGLEEAKGLESINHSGPSALDHRILRDTIVVLPDVFLHGVGYTTEEITVLRKLYGGEARYMDCFISYGSPDEVFAKKLKASLDGLGISSFLYAIDSTPGVPFRKEIYQQLGERDKVILICSQHSLPRSGVVEEIIKTVEQEVASGVEKFLPVRLDGYVLSQELDALEERRIAAGEWKPWVRHLREYTIGDFSGWQVPGEYDAALTRLMKGLRP